MSMSGEDWAEYVTKTDEGYEISKDVPGSANPFGHEVFENHADAVRAVKIGFSAYRGGMWRKQQDFRDLLGIRHGY